MLLDEFLIKSWLGIFWITEPIVDKIIVFLLFGLAKLDNALTLLPTNFWFGEFLSNGRQSHAGNSIISILLFIILRDCENLDNLISSRKMIRILLKWLHNSTAARQSAPSGILETIFFFLELDHCQKDSLRLFHH